MKPIQIWTGNKLLFGFSGSGVTKSWKARKLESLESQKAGKLESPVESWKAGKLESQESWKARKAWKKAGKLESQKKPLDSGHGKPEKAKAEVP